MKKTALLFLILALAIPAAAFAKAGSGQCGAKSDDIDIQMFGSLKTYPHFMGNVDLNSKDTAYDKILDEGGWMANHAVRNEVRLGFQGTGEKWDFLITLESDFILNKLNDDRGSWSGAPEDTGMTGSDFGVEKLNFSYDFGPLAMRTGWDTNSLDLNTGGLLYGDDHPYLGLYGKLGQVGWDAKYVMIQDDIYSHSGVLGGNNLDWRVYDLRLEIPALTDKEYSLKVAPIYAFSDNGMRDARVHYLGVEAYGKLGIVTPRAELIYAVGDKYVGGTKYDIRAWGAYASIDIGIIDSFAPYLGMYYASGDDNNKDKTFRAFNSITNSARYAPTFGMENAFIYRVVPILGTNLYANDFNMLPSASKGGIPGYGGVGNSAMANAPGLVMVGGGVKGAIGDSGLTYKTQLMSFRIANDQVLQQLYNKEMASDMGLEFDLQLTQQYGKHFSVGNVLSFFAPGDAIKDIYGTDFDKTAVCDTIEFKWNF